jgi:arabinan endo-1,5-alpha-L-arabinosidase
MYYVLSKTGTQNSEIGVATSKTMEPGSWTDHGSVGIPANSNYNRIDPNWVSIGGKNYLNFGSFWNDIHQIEMESPLKASSSAAYQLSYNQTLNHREEGAFMFQHGDYYYLLYSAGIAGRYTATYPPEGEEYNIRVCRSKSGTGGFVDRDGTDCTKTGGTLLLASHGQVFGPGGP